MAYPNEQIEQNDKAKERLKNLLLIQCITMQEPR